jgi:peptidoglycan/xylan/chitin deacetylase (PgdA/CDA1 family)
MTRFHILLAATVITVGVAAGLRSPVIAAVAVCLFLIVVGFGVGTPRMRLFGPFACRGPGHERQVALTFDDGPDPRSTPALLDLLRERGVTATFFCIGKNVEAHPQIVARISAEGHALGNHSFSHHYFTSFFTVARLKDEMTRTREAIERAGGGRSPWFRPPIGHSNPRTFRAAREMGLRVVGWTARGLDTLRADPARVVASLKRQISPGGIIVLHDGNIPPERVVATVKSLLDTLRELGYEVVSLEKLLG